MVTYRHGGRLSDLFCKELELLIQHLPSLPFLLFHLDLIFVPITMLPFSIPCLVELDIGSFAEELDILDGSISQIEARSVSILLTCAFFLPIMMGAFR
jgi:hypothetical protein